MIVREVSKGVRNEDQKGLGDEVFHTVAVWLVRLGILCFFERTLCFTKSVSESSLGCTPGTVPEVREPVPSGTGAQERLGG